MGTRTSATLPMPPSCVRTRACRPARFALESADCGWRHNPGRADFAPADRAADVPDRGCAWLHTVHAGARGRGRVRPGGVVRRDRPGHGSGVLRRAVGASRRRGAVRVRLGAAGVARGRGAAATAAHAGGRRWSRLPRGGRSGLGCGRGGRDRGRLSGRCAESGREALLGRGAGPGSCQRERCPSLATGRRSAVLGGPDAPVQGDRGAGTAGRGHLGDAAPRQFLSCLRRGGGDRRPHGWSRPWHSSWPRRPRSASSS